MSGGAILNSVAASSRLRNGWRAIRVFVFSGGSFPCSVRDDIRDRLRRLSRNRYSRRLIRARDYSASYGRSLLLVHSLGGSFGACLQVLGDTDYNIVGYGKDGQVLGASRFAEPIREAMRFL